MQGAGGYWELWIGCRLGNFKEFLNGILRNILRGRATVSATATTALSNKPSCSWGGEKKSFVLPEQRADWAGWAGWASRVHVFSPGWKGNSHLEEALLTLSVCKSAHSTTRALLRPLLAPWLLTSYGTSRMASPTQHLRIMLAMEIRPSEEKELKQ